MAQAVIELDRVTKIYGKGPSAATALSELSLSVKKGEFVAICGPSGSGKSTTLNLIGALDIATSGRVMVDGHDLGKESRRGLARMRRDRIGFVFQAYNLIPVLTARENAELVLSLRGASAKVREERVTTALRQVGLAGLEDRTPDQLSGGQQQRVAIARAMAPEPAIVLADEPTANLDSANAESLLDLMVKLNAELGVTFLFSTHDERVLARAKRIVTLRDGKLLKDEVRAPELVTV